MGRPDSRSDDAGVSLRCGGVPDCLSALVFAAARWAGVVHCPRSELSQKTRDLYRYPSGRATLVQEKQRSLSKHRYREGRKIALVIGHCCIFVSPSRARCVKLALFKCFFYYVSYHCIFPLLRSSSAASYCRPMRLRSGLSSLGQSWRSILLIQKRTYAARVCGVPSYSGSSLPSLSLPLARLMAADRSFRKAYDGRVNVRAAARDRVRRAISGMQPRRGMSARKYAEKSNRFGPRRRAARARRALHRSCPFRIPAPG
ncbi:hypothetical protein ACVWZR_002026 [Bradyrhizobium sp. i1.3.1]